LFTDIESYALEAVSVKLYINKWKFEFNCTFSRIYY
jgi:hypothetical protein